MPTRAEEYTLGVEEEYQIVSTETRALLARSGEKVQRRAQRATMGDEVEPELMTSQIEAVSPVCRTLTEVRTEISRLRREINRAAEEEGGRITAASTHPFSHWNEQRVTPKERYKGLVENYQQLAREQVAFGFHVHVGLSDREAAVRVMNRLRVWLAPMLALSANSPFWLGQDTGYASYRTQVWGRMPVSGPPAPFESREEHDALVKALTASGVVADSTNIYWDLRLPEDLDTIEIRVMDVCSRVDEAVMMAGLTRALVSTCYDEAEREKPYPKTRPELLRAAHWLASRHGLDENLLDVETGQAAPARAVIEELLAFTRPDLEEGGDWDEVSALVYETLEHGNGANRQRGAYQKAGRLEDVVDMLIEETDPA
ncbi:MAG TPA: carboxylate-amine ligase [Rubrobacteraceae bacterium]|nr:carboxylate-amine ligase [Rubrobacteraceae bacterium]